MFELPAPDDDGLFIPEVGEWSKDKHYFLMRYIDAFTTSMSSKKWSGLHFIDLFAGAGIERLKHTKALEWGSPAIAAQAPRPFTALHLCEKDAVRFAALTQRMQTLRKGLHCQPLHGDANQLVNGIIEKIPRRALSLAFLDPYGLHLHYSTLKTLATKRADLIIFFPDHLDALRNCEFVYKDDPHSNLDLYLGTGGWRPQLENAPRSSWAEILRRIYCEQIQRLGYDYFEFERIGLPDGRPLYLLILCSRHNLAARLWENVSKTKPNQQRTFDFGAPG